jgi:hypothetical protein
VMKKSMNFERILLIASVGAVVLALAGYHDNSIVGFGDGGPDAGDGGLDGGDAGGGDAGDAGPPDSGTLDAGETDAGPPLDA